MTQSKTNSKKYEIDMCNGPLLNKIIIYSIPLMLSGILQLLFNAADVIVVGRFAGDTALAAVGSTSSLSNLLINFFMGLSIGSNVMVARFYGAKQYKELNETIHTTIMTALVAGIILAGLGVFISEPALKAMGTPDDVIDQSVLYMRIYFSGMPVILLYNFGAAVLRAIGDTKRPLYYLTIAGVINVVLNMIFVIVFHWGVAGVATATVVSQIFSAGMVIRCLIKTEGYLHLDLKQLRIVPDKLLKMARIGIPAGLQGALFNISNILIQSSINSFGSVVMAGNTAAQNIEGFIYTAMNSVSQSATSFTGQNYGAKKIDRIGKIAVICLGFVTVVGLIGGVGCVMGAPVLLLLYSDSAEVISYGILRMSYCCLMYFLCGVMEVMVGLMRGMGYAILPMIVSLSGACAFRILWVLTIFNYYKTLDSLYISYPISWGLTFSIHLVCFFIVYRKKKKTNT